MNELLTTNGAERLLTAADVAERWQVPKAQVYRLSREGEVPTVRIGRYFRYSVAAIEAFEAAGGVGADG
jgi:excisionase family DNA binding protein